MAARRRKTSRRQTRPVVRAGVKKYGVNLGALEKEIKRLSDLLIVVKRKSALVRHSLAYLEREQRRVMRQINQARRFLTRLKNRGLKAWQQFPGNAEALYRQFKAEFNRLSRKLLSQ
jgi:hypothetical protein